MAAPKFRSIDSGDLCVNLYDVYEPAPGMHPGRYLGQVKWVLRRTGKPREIWLIVGHDVEGFRTRKAAAEALAEIMQELT